MLIEVLQRVLRRFFRGGPACRTLRFRASSALDLSLRSNSEIFMSWGLFKGCLGVLGFRV